MSEVVLNAKSRHIGRHSVITQLRVNNDVPVVLYRKGVEAQPLSVNLREYERVCKGHNRNQVLKIVIDGDAAQGSKAIVRDIQRDVVKGTIIHMDFLGLDDTHPVKVKVPVHFVGEAYGVKTEGGVLQHVLRKIQVLCLPSVIPEFINVDVTPYKNGQAIYVRDIKPTEGVNILTPGKLVIGTIKGTKSVEEEQAAAGTTPAAAEAAPAAAAGDKAAAKPEAKAADAKAKPAKK